MKKLFTESISTETTAELIDEMLRFENSAKQRSAKMLILKAIPAVAVFLLVIGLVNFNPIIPAINWGDGGEPSSEQVPGTSGGEPIEYHVKTVDDILGMSGVLTDIPRLVEREIFERLLARMPQDRSRNMMLAYYSLKNIHDPTLTDRERAELLDRFPFINEVGAFYIFDTGTHASEREIVKMLGIWNEYIGWSDEGYLAMREHYNLIDLKAEARAMIAERQAERQADWDAAREADWDAAREEQRLREAAHRAEMENAWWAEIYPWILEHFPRGGRVLENLDFLINQHGELPAGITKFGVGAEYRDALLAEHLENCDRCVDHRRYGGYRTQCRASLFVVASLKLNYEGYKAWIEADMEWQRRALFLGVDDEFPEIAEALAESDMMLRAVREWHAQVLNNLAQGYYFFMNDRALGTHTDLAEVTE